MASKDTKPESCIDVLVKTFNKHAGKSGVIKEKFQKMVTEDFKDVLTNTEDKEKVNELIMQIDTNEDGKISFKEYWNLISSIADTVSQYMTNHSEVKPSDVKGEKMTEVALSINGIVRYFYEHLTVQGGTKTIATEEFKTMLKNDFPDYIKESSDSVQVLKGPDSKSQEIEFSDYWKIIERFANDLKKQEN